MYPELMLLRRKSPAACGQRRRRPGVVRQVPDQKADPPRRVPVRPARAFRFTASVIVSIAIAVPVPVSVSVPITITVAVSVAHSMTESSAAKSVCTGGIREHRLQRSDGMAMVRGATSRGGGLAAASRSPTQNVLPRAIVSRLDVGVARCQIEQRRRVACRAAPAAAPVKYTAPGKNVEQVTRRCSRNRIVTLRDLPPCTGQRRVQVRRLVRAGCRAHARGGRHHLQLPAVLAVCGALRHGQGASVTLRGRCPRQTAQAGQRPGGREGVLKAAPRTVCLALMPCYAAISDHQHAARVR